MKLIITLNLPDQFDYNIPPMKMRDALDDWVQAHLRGEPSSISVELQGRLILRKASRVAVHEGVDGAERTERRVEAEFDGNILTS